MARVVLDHAEQDRLRLAVRLGIRVAERPVVDEAANHGDRVGRDLVDAMQQIGYPRPTIEQLAGFKPKAWAQLKQSAVLQDRIGAIAEYALVRESAAAKKPARLDYVQAASVPLVGLTAWQALRGQPLLKPDGLTLAAFAATRSSSASAMTWSGPPG